ncbi:MAG: hypothetical protein KAY37_15715 [Phycisphaerae bacterium]|nr:hypothetical protein [Phycisphaerae bacterium]
MRARRHKRGDDLWEELRARMIAETSAWLTEALTHPEQAVRIPTIPAGSGEFPPSLAHAFWEPVLVE